ncbi:DUF6082 family protein [Streptomyces sp. CA-294286]|uniref:DUF6082 family protein n=1 Tax=Streptomyces sp. CA-294286 TaxID=3240070 RepID=UPI003D92E480
MTRRGGSRLFAVVLGTSVLGGALLLAAQQRARNVLAFEAQRQRLLAGMSEHPELHSAWAPLQGTEPATSTPELLHHQAWVSLWAAGYRANVLSLQEIRAAATLLFATATGADFWRWARTWNTDLPHSATELRVYETLDEVYGIESGDDAAHDL